MCYLQYVGDKQIGEFQTKIFVDITRTNTQLTSNPVSRDNYTFQPIHPEHFSKWREHYACSGRWVATQFGDVYEISEEHRDAYPTHLPGFKLINQLELGEVIPSNGFTNIEYLSNGNIKVMHGFVKFKTYCKTFINK